MSTMSQPIPLTDDRGKLLIGKQRSQSFEPEPGSVVLTEGEHGTAWQRFFSDGKWHSIRGGSLHWGELLRKRNLVLVYDASERDDQRGDER